MTAFEFDPETFDEAEVLRNVASDDIGTRAEAIYLLARKALNHFTVPVAITPPVAKCTPENSRMQSQHFVTKEARHNA